MTYGYDDKGSEFFSLVLRKAGSSDNLADIIPDTSGSAVWSADSQYIFYVHLDENHRPSKLFRHKIGSPVSDDVLIHEETDAGFFMSAGKSQSGDWIIIDCHDHQSSECWLIPGERPVDAAAADRSAPARVTNTASMKLMACFISSPIQMMLKTSGSSRLRSASLPATTGQTWWRIRRAR